MQQVTKQDLWNQIEELEEKLSDKLERDIAAFQEIEDKTRKIEEAQKNLHILDVIRQNKGGFAVRSMVKAVRGAKKQGAVQNGGSQEKKSIEYTVTRNEQGVFILPKQKPSMDEWLEQELDSEARTEFAKKSLSFFCSQRMRELFEEICDTCRRMDKSKKGHKKLIAAFGQLITLKNMLLIHQREDLINLFENLSIRTEVRFFFSRDAQEMEEKSRGLILLVTHELSRTGAPVVLANLARLLKKNGWQVLMFSPMDGPLRQTLNQDGITVIVEKRLSEGFYDASYEPDWNKRLLLDHFIRESALCVMNTAVLSNLIKRYQGSFHSIIWWFHEGKQVLKDAGDALPKRLTSNIRPVCVCEYAYEQLKQIGICYEKEILLYGIEDIVQEVEKAAADTDETTRFVVAATIDYRKGQDILLDAVNRLPYSYMKKTEFYFAGKKFREDMSEQMQYYERAYPNVHILGEVEREELFRLYEQMDCVVAPSRDDPMPVTLTEGMARKKVCLCSDHTGTAREIEDGVNGFVFQSENVEALAEKIMEITDKKQELGSIKEAGRKLFEEKLRIDVFEKNVLSMIQRYQRTSRKPLKIEPADRAEERILESLSQSPGEVYRELTAMRENLDTRYEEPIRNYLAYLDLVLDAQKIQRKRYAFLLDITTGEKNSEWYQWYHKLKRERAVKRGDYPEGMKLAEELPEGFSKKKCLIRPIDYLLPPQPVEEKISVVLPTYQAGDEFLDHLAALKLQRGISNLELIVVDSGSTDQTVEIANFMGCQVIQIPQESFTHSGARNLGAKKADGEYVLFMTQDAKPASEYWLYHMVSVLQNEDISAVSSAELPRPDACLQARIDGENHRRFLGLEKEDRICSLPKKKTYEELRKNAQLNDVNCMIKREVFFRYGYHGSFAEDLRLGRNILQDGGKIALLSSIGVIHSHNRSVGYQLKRCFIDTFTLIQMFPDFPIEKMERRERFCAVLRSYCETVEYLEEQRKKPLHDIYGIELASPEEELYHPLLEDTFIRRFFEQLMTVYPKEKWTERSFFPQVQAYAKQTIPEWLKRQEAEGKPLDLSAQEILDTIAKAFASNAGAHLAEVAAEAPEGSRLAEHLKKLAKGV